MKQNETILSTVIDNDVPAEISTSSASSSAVNRVLFRAFIVVVLEIFFICTVYKSGQSDGDIPPKSVFEPYSSVSHDNRVELNSRDLQIEEQPSYPNCTNLANGNWIPVRHVPAGNNWHPATDQLTGVDVYGNPTDLSRAWSIDFENTLPGYEEFLLSTGNCEKWVVARKSSVTGGFYLRDPAQDVIQSSISSTPYKANWLRREGKPEDPWISLLNLSLESKVNGDIVYGENGVPNDASATLPINGGADVYIRYSPSLSPTVYYDDRPTVSVTKKPTFDSGDYPATYAPTIAGSDLITKKPTITVGSDDCNSMITEAPTINWERGNSGDCNSQVSAKGPKKGSTKKSYHLKVGGKKSVNCLKSGKGPKKRSKKSCHLKVGGKKSVTCLESGKGPKNGSKKSCHLKVGGKKSVNCLKSGKDVDCAIEKNPMKSGDCDSKVSAKGLKKETKKSKSAEKSCNSNCGEKRV